MTCFPSPPILVYLVSRPWFSPTCLGCAVNVLNGEHGAQSVEQNLGQGRDELSGRDQHIDTVGSEDKVDWVKTQIYPQRSLVLLQHGLKLLGILVGCEGSGEITYM